MTPAQYAALHGITELQALRALRARPAALAWAMRERPWIRSMMK
jgi:hypothetical protein